MCRMLTDNTAVSMATIHGIISKHEGAALQRIVSAP